jgi:hypothetical protein
MKASLLPSYKRDFRFGLPTAGDYTRNRHTSRRFYFFVHGEQLRLGGSWNREERKLRAAREG